MITVLMTALTVPQIRAGRALLGWSQQDLARVAGVATSTVADFERGRRVPVTQNALAMRTALEQAGVSFPPGGAVVQSFAAPTSESRSPGQWTSARAAR